MNVIGALTSKPYAFTVRPWELKRGEFINFLDGLGDIVRVDYKGGDVVRILPKESGKVEWISDKVRFMYDGFRRQRITRPFIRKWNLNKKEDMLISQEWNEVLSYQLINYEKSRYLIEGITGGFVDIETQVIFKDFLNRRGSKSFLALVDGMSINNDFRRNYLIKVDLNKLEEYEMVVLVGVNLRVDYPLLNYRVRKIKGFVGVLGFVSDLSYLFVSFGNKVENWLKLLEGRHLMISMMMLSSLSVMLIGNSGRLNGVDYLDMKFSTVGYYSIVNLLNLYISITGGLDIGGVYNENMLMDNNAVEKWLYLVDVDEISDVKDGFFDFFDYDMVIYQGHHGDVNAEKADIILPGVIPLEKESVYESIEGKLSRNVGNMSLTGQGLVDWKIVSLMSIQLKTVEEIKIRINEYLFGSMGWLEGVRMYSYIYRFGNGAIDIWQNGIMSDSIVRSSVILNMVVYRAVNKVWWLN